MKFILCCIFCFLSLCSFSQTKEETENWLSYYLDKYFSTDIDYWRKLNNVSPSLFVDNSTYYTTHAFKFYKKILVIREFHIKEDSTGFKILEQREDSLFLDNVIKITIATSKEEQPKMLTVELEFKKTDLDKNYFPKNVVHTNYETGKIVDAITDEEYDISSSIDEVLTDNLPVKIQLAFEHIVELNGGKVIKDIF